MAYLSLQFKFFYNSLSDDLLKVSWDNGIVSLQYMFFYACVSSNYREKITLFTDHRELDSLYYEFFLGILWDNGLVGL